MQNDKFGTRKFITALLIAIITLLFSPKITQAALITLIPTLTQVPAPAPTAIPQASPSPAPTPTADYSHLRLSEIMACPNSGSSEWIEIENFGPESINLQDLILRDSSATIYTFANQLAKSSSFISVDINSKLNNSGDEVSLVRVSNPNQIIDQMSYVSCTNGSSWNFLHDYWYESNQTSRDAANIEPSPTPIPTATPTITPSSTPTPIPSLTPSRTPTPTKTSASQTISSPSNQDQTPNQPASNPNQPNPAKANFDLPQTYLQSLKLELAPPANHKTLAKPNASLTDTIANSLANKLLGKQKWAFINVIMGGLTLLIWGSYYLYGEYQQTISNF